MNNSSKEITIPLFFLLGLTLASLVYWPGVIDPSLTPRLFVWSLIILCTTLWLFKKSPFAFTFDLIRLTFFLFVLWCVISITWSNTSSEAFFESAKWLCCFGTFGLGLYFLNENCEGVTKLITNTALFITFFISLFVIIQLLFLPNLQQETLYSVTGLNGHKNLITSFLFLMLFFLLSGALGDHTRGLKWMYLFQVLICLALIVILRTKAVWFGLCCTLTLAVVYFVLRKLNLLKNKNILLSTFFVLILLNLFFLFVLPYLISKGLQHANSSLGSYVLNQQAELEKERLELWKKTYYLIQHHPWLGVGMGNWQIEMPTATLRNLWRAEDLNFTFQRPHNDLLWILSETGFIGLNLFLFFVSYLILKLLKCAAHIKNQYHKQLQLLLPAAFIFGYTCISFFDFPRERIEHLIWFSFSVAIAVKRVQESELNQTVIPHQYTKIIRIGILTVLGCVLLIAFLRVKGEYYTRLAYQSKQNQQQAEVIKYGNLAHSFAYCIDPTSLPIGWYTGNAQASMGNYPEAFSNFKQAFHENPNNRNVLNDLASAYAFLNQNDSALVFYKKASLISPRFDDPKLNSAAIYIQQEQFQKAKSCLDSLYHNSERRTNFQKIVAFGLKQN